MIIIDKSSAHRTLLLLCDRQIPILVKLVKSLEAETEEEIDFKETVLKRFEPNYEVKENG